MASEPLVLTLPPLSNPILKVDRTGSSVNQLNDNFYYWMYGVTQRLGGPDGLGAITSITSANSLLTASTSSGSTILTVNQSSVDVNALSNYPITIAHGGTGEITANAALNALLPSQTSKSGYYFTTDGTNTSWASISLDINSLTGYPLTEVHGGTNQTVYAQGDILFASATNTLSKLAKSNTSTHYLSNTGTSNNPAWTQIDVATGITGIVPAANGGTGVSNTGTITLGGNLTTSGSFTTTLTVTGNTNVTLPTSGTLITSAAVPSLPLSTANGGMGADITAGGVGAILYSTATTTYGVLANPAATGRVMRSGLNAAPTWTGYSIPVSGTTNALLYWSGTTALGATNTQGSSVLVTDSSSVPSFSTIIPRCNHLGIKLNLVNVTAATYTILISDVIVGVNRASAVTLTLPAASTAGGFWIIQDESGAAGTNNITIAAPAGGSINGAANIKIITNYGGALVYGNATTGVYFSSPAYV